MQGEREREVKTSSRGREMEVCGESVTQMERLLSLPSEKSKGGGRDGWREEEVGGVGGVGGIITDADEEAPVRGWRGRYVVGKDGGSHTHTSKPTHSDADEVPICKSLWIRASAK
jgi:hypothetical protein